MEAQERRLGREAAFRLSQISDALTRLGCTWKNLRAKCGIASLFFVSGEDNTIVFCNRCSKKVQRGGRRGERNLIRAIRNITLNNPQRCTNYRLGTCFNNTKMQYKYKVIDHVIILAIRSR